MKTGILTLFFAIAIVAGCSEQDGTTTEPVPIEGASLPLSAPATLQIAVNAEPGTLNIQKAILGSELRIIYQLYLHLLELDADGNIIPGAAKHWNFSNDDRTLTFELRNDLTWSDGQPIDAYDFLFALRQYVDPGVASYWAFAMEEIVNAKAIAAGELAPDQLGVSVPASNPYQLIVEFNHPAPHMLRIFHSIGPATPLPRHVIEAHPEDWATPERWVSNGPYLLKEWRPQEYVELMPNPRFYEEVPIKSVRFVPTANPMNAYNRFRSGQLHVTTDLPPREISNARQSFPAALREADSMRISYLVFNVTQPPFDDINLRQALGMTIDTALITEKILHEGYTTSFSYVPATVRTHQHAYPPHHGLSIAERRSQAKALLKAAGFGEDNPLKVNLRYLDSGVAMKQAMIAIMGMWREIGVIAQLQQSEAKVHYADLENKDYQVALSQWGGLNSATSFLREYAQTDYSINLSGYSSSSYTALWQQALAASNRATREQLLHQAEALLLKDYTVAPLFREKQVQLVDVNLRGWHPNPLGRHPVRFISWNTGR